MTLPMGINRTLAARIVIIAAVCLVMVIIHAAQLLSGGALSAWGLHPRDPAGLAGIFAAPWIHADVGHLGSNLFGMAVLGGIGVARGVRYFTMASVIIIAVSGLLLWMFGRDAVHIGASGWIFGLWSLAIATGWYERDFRSIAISVAVILLHGGMVFGMLPITQGVSFEGHIFGAVAGVFAAWLLHGARNRPVQHREPSLKFWP